jgi:glycerophosphoryl diester phosphodiesterase
MDGAIDGVTTGDAHPSPIWVAHRGWPTCFPENTLPGYEAALKQGCTHIETDIQLSADGIPYLYHDETLKRLSNQSGLIMEQQSANIDKMESYYPSRFGNDFKGTKIPRLSHFVDFMADWQDVTVFVEIKEESIQHFGLFHTIDIISKAIRPIKKQSVLISFSHEAVKYVRDNSDTPIGWVIPDWNQENQHRASTLKPDFLICNQKRLPVDNNKIWQGNWEWLIYTVNTEANKNKLLRSGFRYLETDNIGDFLNGEATEKKSSG